MLHSGSTDGRLLICFLVLFLTMSPSLVAYRFNRSHAFAGGQGETFAIGDGHGDMYFLVHALLSTGKFSMHNDGSDTIWWKEGLKQTDNFEIILCGDLVDRGTRSKASLELLYKLQQHEKLGHKLIFLLGNHESAVLRYMFHWAAPDGGEDDWGVNLRRSLFEANAPSTEFLFLQWLRQRPVLHLRNRVLFAHGGLSKEVAENVRDSLPNPASATPQEFVDAINMQARRYYEDVFECVKLHMHQTGKDSGPDACGLGQSFLPYRRPNIPDIPPILSLGATTQHEEETGVLWFRGYSAVLNSGQLSQGLIGAGSVASCTMAKDVGSLLQIDAMVVAHSTHAHVTKFCEDGPVQILAIDTSWKLCQNVQLQDDDHECDFSMMRTRPQRLHPSKDFVAQSLKIVGPTFEACGQRQSDGQCSQTLKIDSLADLQLLHVPRSCAPLTSAVLGVAVQRGPHWKWGDQDGGAGKRGITIARASAMQGWTRVRWNDNGYEEEYRAGAENAFDLCLLCTTLNSAALDVVVQRGPDWKWFDQDGGIGKRGVTIPHISATQGLVGVRWKGSGHENIYRVGAENAFDLCIVEGCSSLTTAALGVVVQRGLDWKWRDQDGGAGKHGITIARAGAMQGWVGVRWKDSGREEDYRVGAEHAFDLCIVE